MAIFQGLVFLVFGAGLLLVCARSLTRHGTLPMGPRGFSGTMQVRRDTQPLLYATLLFVYAAAGVALLVFSIGLLIGVATPLPLR